MKLTIGKLFFIHTNAIKENIQFAFTPQNSQFSQHMCYHEQYSPLCWMFFSWETLNMWLLLVIWYIYIYIVHLYLVFADIVFSREVPADMFVWTGGGVWFHHRGRSAALPPLLSSLALPTHHYCLGRQLPIHQKPQRRQTGGQDGCAQVPVIW